MKLHNPAVFFVQVVENALEATYADDERWKKVHLFYEKRYLNPNSPYKSHMRLHGYMANNYQTRNEIQDPAMNDIFLTNLITLKDEAVNFKNKCLEKSEFEKAAHWQEVVVDLEKAIKTAERV